MIVLGIDPGGRNTGYAVIDTSGGEYAVPRLLESRTVVRPDAGERMADVPREVLLDLVGVAEDLVVRFVVELVAVEGVNKPRGHAAGRRGHIIDAGPIVATAQVYGALAGHGWACLPKRPASFVRIEPGRNGHLLPLTAYPEPLRTTGKGQDKRRHERSAYDVAMMGPQTHAIEARRYRS